MLALSRGPGESANVYIESLLAWYLYTTSGPLALSHFDNLHYHGTWPLCPPLAWLLQTPFLSVGQSASILLRLAPSTAQLP